MFPLSLSLSLPRVLEGLLVFHRDEVSSSSATSFPRDEKERDPRNEAGYSFLPGYCYIWAF